MGRGVTCISRLLPCGKSFPEKYNIARGQSVTPFRIKTQAAGAGEANIVAGTVLSRGSAEAPTRSCLAPGPATFYAEAVVLLSSASSLHVTFPELGGGSPGRKGWPREPEAETPASRHDSVSKAGLLKVRPGILPAGRVIAMPLTTRRVVWCADARRPRATLCLTSPAWRCAGLLHGASCMHTFVYDIYGLAIN
ncbi:hypothetical protein E2C01_019694 [Portunus trituberculatus]|uniref:Uncharacterized protein n=1 Tax=Portunus trituberculatus TaxID=210409 RepID=A0A5B7DY46_PORTR|nr:hypothetical protein [Portunus trituberculatus]